MAEHVAILLRPYLKMILDGRKTVESRFTIRPLPPYRRIAAGDRIFFKASAGPYMARAKAGRVEFFENLSVSKMRDIYRAHNRGIQGAAEFWKAKKHSRYGTLIWLKDVEAVDSGPAMEPSRGPAWFVLKDSADDAKRARGASRESFTHSACGDFEARLTAGAIRNRYVALPGDVAARLRGRVVTLRLPDGAEVASGIIARRLRWRGWGPYFERHQVKPGSMIRFRPHCGRWETVFVAAAK